MFGDSLGWIQSRLQNDAQLTLGAKNLVSESLSAQTTGTCEIGQVANGAGPLTARVTHQARLFISHFWVRGFRGIGPEVQLEFAPEPGLTIITGRNGSGKSSLAEALELVTTGEVRRLEVRTSAWKENWRNVHTEGASARVCLEPEGHTSTTPHIELLAQWEDKAKLPDVHRSLFVGGRAVESTESWDNDAHAHRPLLMYEDISELLKSVSGNPARRDIPGAGSRGLD